MGKSEWHSGWFAILLRIIKTPPINQFGSGMGAVSYTHLDVYKRQDLGYSAKGKTAFWIAWRNWYYRNLQSISLSWGYGLSSADWVIGSVFKTAFNNIQAVKKEVLTEVNTSFFTFSPRAWHNGTYRLPYEYQRYTAAKTPVPARTSSWNIPLPHCSRKEADSGY